MGEVLRARGHEVMLIVSEKEIDAVATHGRLEFQIEKVPGVGLQGKSPAALLEFGRRFLAGFRKCSALFGSFDPAAVLGMGGFTSFAPILAGRRRRVPTFVHDSNAIPGKANRLNARFCSAVLLGFEECAQHFPKQRCVVTGTPVRSSLARSINRVEALDSFHLKSDRKTLLIMGGSQGAHGINSAIIKALPKLKETALQIIHLTGRHDEAVMREAYDRAGIPAHVAAFFHQMELAYSAADLAVARSGAASLTELSHFSLPSILIPYPVAAEDHQTLNAKVFERAGAAILIPERDAAPEYIASEIRSLFDSPIRLSEMSTRAGALAQRDAAERVANVILSHAQS